MPSTRLTEVADALPQPLPRTGGRSSRARSSACLPGVYPAGGSDSSHTVRDRSADATLAGALGTPPPRPSARVEHLSLVADEEPSPLRPSPPNSPCGPIRSDVHRPVAELSVNAGRVLTDGRAGARHHQEAAHRAGRRRRQPHLYLQRAARRLPHREGGDAGAGGDVTIMVL